MNAPKAFNPRPIRILGAVLCALLILGTAAFIWFSPQKPTIAVSIQRSRAELELRDGRLHIIGQPQPFTGLVTDTYEGGQLKSRSAVLNGLLEGMSEGWYTNGQIQVQEHFSSGVSHGRRIKWYPSGAKLSQATIVNGELHGTFQRWYENGQVSEQVEMAEGRPSGLSLAYHSNGSLKARVIMQDGLVLNQQLSPDGSPSISEPNR